MDLDPLPRSMPAAPAAGVLVRARALGRLLRGPLLAAALAGLAIAAATRVPGLAFAATAGLVAGAWAGLWIARPLRGRADLRALVPVCGIAVGAVAAGLPPSTAAGLALALMAAVAAARYGTARLKPGHDWDDPTASALALAVLATGAASVLALRAGVPTGALGLPGVPSVVAALVLGSVAGYALGLTFAAVEGEDPFATDPRRTLLAIGLLAILLAGLLAMRAPRLVPLLALVLLVPASGGRPRLVGALAPVFAAAAIVLAMVAPDLLVRIAGGWPVPAAMGLVAAMLALALLGSLLAHQRDRIRARLRAASGHLLTLAEKSPGLVATFDREHRHRHVNDAYARWTATPRERLLGLPLVDALGPAVATALATSAARAMAGASQQLQVERGERLLDIRLEPFFGLDGAISGFHLLAEDVTWRRQGERELRALVDASPQPTLVLDEDGRIRMHNSAAAEALQAGEVDLVGTPLTAWLCETGPAPGDIGMHARRADGSMFPIELRLGSMPGEHGGRSVVTLRDLSRTRALENAARVAREQAQSTLDSISDALVVVDPAGKVSGFNPAAVVLTGWTRDDAVGRAVDEVVRIVEPGRDAPRPSMLAEVLRDGRVVRSEGELEIVRVDGARRPVESSASPLRDAGGRPIGAVLLIRDVSEAREQAQALTHMAQHDALTGLPNRVLFQDRLTQALAQVARGHRGAVLYIDLDKFKPINDTLGHPVGDRVLQEVASRLRECVREDDTVSRQGGDEFVLLLQRLADPRDAARVAEKLIRSVEQPILLDGHELRVGASVGISLFPQDGRDARTLMRQADTALYHVKQTGRGRFSYFTDVMGESAEARMRVEHDLRLALAHGDFVLDYQPVAAAAGGWRSIEALLRWCREDTVVLPEDFLDVAEETGLIAQIDEWVLEAACREAARWRAAGAAAIPVSVNVSLARFDPDGVLARVRSALAATGLAPEGLELEFRGTQLFAHPGRSRTLVEDLRALGVRVTVDDIGSGQVSVAELADHPFDALKLDRAIVRRLTDDERARRIAQAICRMGSALGYPVIAKGVEIEAHRDLLLRWGCLGLQGTLYSPPLRAADVAGAVAGPGAPLARRA